MEEITKEKQNGFKNNIKETNSQADLRGEFLWGEAEFHRLSKDWDDLFTRDKEAPAFFSRAWTQTFINQKRFKGNPCLIAVWSSSKLVALLPLSVRSICGIRIAKSIGSTEPSYLGLLLDPDYTEAVNVVAEIWNRKKVAHVLCNKYLSSLDKATHKLITELSHRGFAHKSGYKRICHLIQLGCSFDEYLQKKIKKGKRRYKLRYEEKKLFKSGDVKVTRYIGKDITAEIHQRIATIQNESWMKQRDAAVLGQQFYQNLLTNMAEAGLSSVWLMTIDGDDAAFAYTFITHGKLYYHWPAFKLKYESGLSVGQMLLMQIIRDACDEKVLLFDFGIGDAEYKRFWSTDTPYVEWIMAGQGFPGHLAMLCYSAIWWLAKRKLLFSLYSQIQRRFNIFKQYLHSY